MSQQIASLEREAGVTLVVRGPRGVVLTDPGRVLVASAGEVLGRLAAAGVGVALFPLLTLPAVRPDIVVRPLVAHGLSRQVRAALPPGAYRPPAATAMIDLLGGICRTLEAEAASRLRRQGG